MVAASMRPHMRAVSSNRLCHEIVVRGRCACPEDGAGQAPGAVALRESQRGLRLWRRLYCRVAASCAVYS